MFKQYAQVLGGKGERIKKYISRISIEISNIVFS